MKKDSAKRIAACGMLCAAAFVITAVFRLPVFPSAPFLKIDFKDTIISLAGFIYGPIYTVLISVIVAFLEFITVSESGFIGFIMNSLSSISLSLVAALIYKYRRKISGAAIGLLSGALIMTAFMILWNWLITPLYTGTPRAAVEGMLIPVILPFNLLKSFLCSSLTLILYRPVTAALKRAKLLPDSEKTPKSSKITAIVTTTGIVIASICILSIVLIKIYG
ncbi:MAG: ECF transporter S component [Clostridia bacterium]|nr:ECF transporter S component [Clostridia bacterium]